MRVHVYTRIWNPSLGDFSEASLEIRRGIQRLFKMNMTTPQRTVERAANPTSKMISKAALKTENWSGRKDLDTLSMFFSRLRSYSKQ